MASERVLAVASAERSLLVVSNLVSAGRPGLRWLYRFAETCSVAVARVVLGRLYAEILVLRDSDATAQGFVDRLARLASDPGTRAVDVLLHLHGDRGVLIFAEGPLATRELGLRLRQRELSPKMRLLYSTACYGATHAADFVDAGFRTASGARGTNANGAYDYIVQLALWALSVPYERALGAGNLRLPLRLFDAAARCLGFAEVDSLKIVCGDPSTSISACPSGGMPHR